MKTTPKKSFLSKFFHSATSQDEVEVPVDRIPLMNEQEEILPNLYVSSLVQVLEKRPKDFLDSIIPIPKGSVREFLAYQEFKDTYCHASKEEYHEHINKYLSSIFFDDDVNIAQAISCLHKEQLTTMNFGHIREFLKKILREKMRNEEQYFKDQCWHTLPYCLLGLNVGVVSGLGLYLLKKEENKFLPYTTLGIALSGVLILVPKFYQKSVSLYCSAKRFHNYDIHSQILEQNVNATDNKIIYKLTN